MTTAFIIGSPRSGTTVLGNILDCHDHIAEWYEPYYMWAFFVGNRSDDVWEKKYLSSKAKDKIIKEYKTYQKKSGKKLIVEKTPGHAFHIELINKVFPSAKWIHLIRDGRDTTLSIKKEWIKRGDMVKNKSYDQLFNTAFNMLKRQPYYKYRLMAMVYEFISIRSLSPQMYLNKSKWKGKPYWGPRFKGWEAFIKSHSHIEFNAMQWVKSVAAVHSKWGILPEKNRLEIRYEQMLQNPRETLIKILDFLEHKPSKRFFKSIPQLRPDNFNKWEAEFTSFEIEKIKPILTPMLEKTGYLKNNPW